MRILVIEDDKETANYLAHALKESGYVVDVANDGEDGLHMALTEQYDVIILDRMLPKLDGLSVVNKIRKNNNATPVLILSALSDVDDRVKGLTSGGDDYLPKPYAMDELLARVAVLTKRQSMASQDTAQFKVGDLIMDRLSRSVSRDGQEISLQPREYLLLEYLVRNAGKLVTRTMLLENVWNYHFDPQTNVIDVHISRLRNKIDKGFDSNLLHTIRGAGYILKPSGGKSGAKASRADN